MRKRFVPIARCRCPVIWVRCGLVITAIGFACTACSRVESSTQRKAASNISQGAARDHSASANPVAVIQNGSHTRSASSDEHVLSQTILPGTIDVPPAFLQNGDKYFIHRDPIGSQIDSSGINGQLSPAGQTPDAPVAPLPSAAWSGMVLLIAVGVAMLFMMHRVRSRLGRKGD